MKKQFFSIISVLLLLMLTSCAGLNDNFSSVSIQFPEGTSTQLKQAREEGAPSSEPAGSEHPYESVFCTLEVTGDYTDKATKYYSTLEDLNGSSIAVADIPVNSNVRVSVTLSFVGNEGGYYGISDTITVVKGDNYVNLTLKPVTSLGLTTPSGFEAVCVIDGKTYRNGSTIPYVDSEKILVQIYENGNILTLNENYEAHWSVYKNNAQLTDSKYTIKEREASIELESVKGQYLIKFEYFSTNLEKEIRKTTSISFNINNAAINTDYLWWNLHTDTNDMSTCGRYDLYALEALDPTSSLSESDRNTDTHNITYISISKTSSKVIDLENTFVSGGSVPGYYDHEEQMYYFYINDTQNILEQTPEGEVKNVPCDFTESSFKREYSFVGRIACNGTYLVQIMPDKINISKLNNGSYTTVNSIDTDFDPDTKIFDVLILNDVLYILASNFTKYSNSNESGEFCQYGSLYSLNLKNPTVLKTVQQISTSSSTYNGSYSDKGDTIYQTLSVNKPVNTIVKAFHYAPVKIIAIKGKDLWIAETGYEFESSNEDNQRIKKTEKSRAVKVNLESFSVTDAIDMSDKILTQYENVGTSNYTYFN